MNEEFDDMIFDSDGELLQPTADGSASAFDPGDGLSLISGDDDLQDVGPAAGPATDIYDSFEESGMDIEPESDGADGMQQTDYGAHPWGPDTRSAQIPHSMLQTDRSLNGTEGDEEDINAALDPGVYDRVSFERGGKTRGSGIFDMEEQGTFRPAEGIFAHDFALPSYIADEDEMDIQQSQMWDMQAGGWRTVQPTSGGVALSRRRADVSYSPFTNPGGAGRRPQQPATSQNGDIYPVPGGRSGPVPLVPLPRELINPIESFGKECASYVMSCAKQAPDSATRGRFIANIVGALGPGKAQRADAIAKRLVAQGYPGERALHDTLTHLFMHAAAEDLQDTVEAIRSGKVDAVKAANAANAAVAVTNGDTRPVVVAASEKFSSLLPRVSKMTDKAGTKIGVQIKKIRNKNLAAAVKSPDKGSAALGAFYASPSPLGTEAPTPSPAVADTTTRNLLIGAAVAGGAWLAWKSGALKSVSKNLGLATVKAKPNKRKGRKTSRRGR